MTRNPLLSLSGPAFFSTPLPNFLPNFLHRRPDAGTGRYGERRASSTAIGATVAVHAAILGAYLLMPGENFIREHYRTLITYAVPEPRDPNPVKPEPQRKSVTQPVHDTVPDKVIDLPTHSDFTLPPLDPHPFGAGGGDIIDPGPVTPPPHTPTFIDSKVDARFMRDFQPDYPPARERAQEEGTATVRVHIGADGRVTAVEEISATHPDFWKATQVQALRRWRFVPATRDGVPIDSVREMTVHFRIQA